MLSFKVLSLETKRITSNIGHSGVVSRIDQMIKIVIKKNCQLEMRIKRSKCVSRSSRNNTRHAHIPYEIVANGRRTICFNFWLSM